MIRHRRPLFYRPSRIRVNFAKQYRAIPTVQRFLIRIIESGICRGFVLETGENTSTEGSEAMKKERTSNERRRCEVLGRVAYY